MRNRTREQLSPEETQIMVINHLMSTLFRPRRIPLSEVLERIGKAAEKSQKRREKAWLMENLMLNGVPKKVLRKHEEDIKRLQNFYEFLRDPRISKENRKAIWREINEIVASIKKDIGETHEKR
ncbi:hypothetical protein DRN74_03840 [Candidatus Micrarchaeota archaeon]|nr:MAG: hypothetical protein DRN74_03840 [Candidatus Micrarchaeota archaeon]